MKNNKFKVNFREKLAKIKNKYSEVYISIFLYNSIKLLI